MATVKKVAPDCARKDCGHGRGVHRKKTIRKRVLIKCTVPGCACRTYLEPLPDGKPRPTAPNADKKYPAEVLTPDEIHAVLVAGLVYGVAACTLGQPAIGLGAIAANSARMAIRYEFVSKSNAQKIQLALAICMIANVFLPVTSR